MRRPALLTLNAGSSSVKFSLFLVEDDAIVETPHVWGQIDGIGTALLDCLAATARTHPWEA